jgi:acyl-CoA synthetase (NDP forming)
MTAIDPIAAAREEGRTTLTEPEAKRLLADAGVDVPTYRVAADAEEAVDAAAEVGYPVVAKVCSPAVAHKSEWGGGVGVAVGLESAEAVREAAAAILETAADEGISADVLIEAAAPLDRGTEVIVGGLRDPSFGPTVLVGLGGVFTEVYEDVAHRLAPIDAAEAREAIDELTAATLLSGYRGAEAADLTALADCVVAVSDLLSEREAIVELDVNPVLATPEGATALDAFVRLSEDE